MPATYENIATTTLTSNTTNVEFLNISQAFTDLVLVVSAKDSGTGTVNTNIRVGNGSFDTGSNYSYTFLGGSGSAASSGRSSNITSTLWGAIGTTNNTVAMLHFMNYSNTTTNKTILSRNSLPDQSSGQSVSAWALLWRSTSAINRIQLYPGGQQFASGSTFTLYGIKAA